MNFEPVTTAGLRLVATLPQNATSGIYEWRVNTDHGKDVESVQDIDARGTFRLVGDSLLWTIDIHNPTSKPLAHLEYYDQEEERAFTAYIHSEGRGEELTAKGGKWRLPHTRVSLAPKGQSGDSATYGFKFRWAKDYENVRDVVYEEGGVDVNVLPGMTVPTDLPIRLALRTRQQIRGIVPEFPDQTAVTSAGERGNGTHIYSVKFSHLGENTLKVEYGDGQSLALDFFVTEPLG